MEKTVIRNIAKKTLQDNSQTKIPINVKSICKKENISIRYNDFTDLEKKAQKPISGFIIRDNGNNKTQIYINDNDRETRQNFTLAHELGHYYLHMNDDDNGLIISFRGDSNPIEREANIFATEILMPRELVINEYNKVPFPTVGYLARMFDVSKSAMQIRLDELELEYIG